MNPGDYDNGRLHLLSKPFEDLRALRMIAVLGAVVSLVSLVVAGLALAVQRDHVYVLQVDQHGRAQLGGPLGDQTLSPADDHIRSTLTRVVRNLKTIPADEKILRENLNEVYDYYLSTAARNAISDYLSAHNPQERLLRGDFTRVEVKSLRRLDANNTWLVQWVETRDARGTSKPQPWSATITFTFAPSQNPLHRQHNPWGLTIQALDWGPESEVTQ